MVDGDEKRPRGKLQKSHTYSKGRSPNNALLAMRRGSFVHLFGSSGLLTNSSADSMAVGAVVQQKWRRTSRKFSLAVTDSRKKRGGSNPLLAVPSTSQTSLYSSGSGSFLSPGPNKQELSRVLFRTESENDENNDEQSSSDASSTTAEITESLYPAAVKELEQLGLHRAGGPGQTSGIFNVLTSSNASSSGVMRRVMRVIVAGSKRVGKTACLQQLARFQDITGQPYNPTIDDTYQVQIEYPDRPKEVIVFHDTAGISDYGPIELRRPYIQVADAFVLVYAVNDHESFNRMDLLKKYIEKQFGKDKKEVPIVVLGTKTDQTGRKVDLDFATSWAVKERVKLFEVTATDRNTLTEAINYLSSRYFHPPKESKFSLSKKLKPEKSNTAIVMDF